MSTHPVFTPGEFGFWGRWRIGTQIIAGYLLLVVLLEAYKIPIQGRDTGGSHGRTVRFYLASGQVTVRTMLRERVLP